MSDQVETTTVFLQADVDAWIVEYNENRPHSGKYCFGKTPMEKFRSANHLAQEKQLDHFLISTEGFSGSNPGVATA